MVPSESTALVSANMAPQLPLKPAASSSESGSSSSIDAAALWDQQDQLILRWIIASLSESTISHVVSASTSHEAWEISVHVFAPTSRTRVMDLKDRLFCLQCGSDTITEYLLTARSIADTFAAIDHPVNDEDLVLAVLRGLGSEYRDFAASIRLRPTPVTFVELSGLLLSHESFLRSTDGAVSVSSANMATGTSSGGDSNRSVDNRSGGARRSRGNRYRSHRHSNNGAKGTNATRGSPDPPTAGTNSRGHARGSGQQSPSATSSATLFAKYVLRLAI
ncbi:uncharacterized protein LOC122659033 [Telopea speciosissima]|uniref:uncharacterized protein LOC122659033 n=1 Tax=Telopea speciosissima TaxID=54955 RepID=UPI001CC80489|nr:uncharacterized protein LOC122659033 [Telopea speciosissima]